MCVCCIFTELEKVSFCKYDFFGSFGKQRFSGGLIKFLVEVAGRPRRDVSSFEAIERIMVTLGACYIMTDDNGRLILEEDLWKTFQRWVNTTRSEHILSKVKLEN